MKQPTDFPFIIALLHVPYEIHGRYNTLVCICKYSKSNTVRMILLIMYDVRTHVVESN